MNSNFNFNFARPLFVMSPGGPFCPLPVLRGVVGRSSAVRPAAGGFFFAVLRFVPKPRRGGSRCVGLFTGSIVPLSGQFSLVIITKLWKP